MVLKQSRAYLVPPDDSLITSDGRQPLIEDDLKNENFRNEDKLKNKDDLKNDNSLKNEDNLNNGDDPNMRISIKIKTTGWMKLPLAMVFLTFL